MFSGKWVATAGDFLRETNFTAFWCYYHFIRIFWWSWQPLRLALRLTYRRLLGIEPQFTVTEREVPWEELPDGIKEQILAELDS